MKTIPRIRAVVVDDEALARERLIDLLQGESDIEVVAQCSDGHEAVQTIRRLTPELVFLDIRMPELDGFGVVAELGQEIPPALVFVTAYDKYALKAFEVHALDYLLKPFDRERLRTALDRARRQLRQQDHADLNRRLSGLLAELRPDTAAADRIAVKTEGRILFVRLEDIDWVEAADNYVSLHVGSESHLLRETMTALESRLPERKFMRISRSTMVNVDRIKELQPLFHGEYSVILRSGTRLTLSRGYREKLDQLLGRPD